MKRKIEEQLLAWKNKTSDRLPLIVNGARQVGKTYILRKFGEDQECGLYQSGDKSDDCLLFQ